MWIDAFGLWDHLSDRVSTIYMPDRKWPMLPVVLSEGLCSLVKGEPRFALAMDVLLGESCQVVDVSFRNTKISVSDNFEYESLDLLANSRYRALHRIAGSLPHDGCGPSLAPPYDSHDVVSKLMIMMNYRASLLLSAAGKGVFRSVGKSESTFVPPCAPAHVVNKVHAWKGLSGSYVGHTSPLGHEALGLASYVHVTSPIRRFVDVMNMVELMRILSGPGALRCAEPVLSRWYSRLDFLNRSSKDVQRIQTDAAALDYCLSRGADECVVTGYPYSGQRGPGASAKYRVYVPELGTVCGVTVQTELEEFSELRLAVRVFSNESRLGRRVRIFPL